MSTKEKKLLKTLPCDSHYKKNLIKFMKFYDLDLVDSLNYIFDRFFTELNELILNKKVPRSSFSLEDYFGK